MARTIEQLLTQRQALEKQIKAIDGLIQKAKKAEAEARKMKALQVLEKSGLLDLPEADLLAALKGMKTAKTDTATAQSSGSDGAS